MRPRRRFQLVRDSEELNISPLIDMTFLLLIFFMVSATFVRDHELEIERPGARTASEVDPGVVRVTIDRGGRIRVDDRLVQEWMVQSYVRDRLTRTGRSSVLVVIDERNPSGQLVDVVDQCRLAGARDVGVAVDDES